MTKQNKTIVISAFAISIVAGIFVLAYFLIKKKKENGTHRVIKPINFGSGFAKNGKGQLVSLQNYAPKVGDVITLGNLEERHVWSSPPQKGYTYYVTQDGITADNKMFILENQVELV